MTNITYINEVHTYALQIADTLRDVIYKTLINQINFKKTSKTATNIDVSIVKFAYMVVNFINQGARTTTFEARWAKLLRNQIIRASLTYCASGSAAGPTSYFRLDSHVFEVLVFRSVNFVSFIL